MVYGETCFILGFATALTLVAIAFPDIIFYCDRYGNSRGFGHNFVEEWAWLALNNIFILWVFSDEYRLGVSLIGELKYCRFQILQFLDFRVQILS